MGQYQDTPMSCHTVNITYMLTLLVHAKAINLYFHVYLHENTCMYQYHSIEVKTISRILCSSIYVHLSFLLSFGASNLCILYACFLNSSYQQRVHAYIIASHVMYLFIEVYQYGFFAQFRYPILKSCKVLITDN